MNQMESFEGLQNIDNFCKVIVKKSFAEHFETRNGSGIAAPKENNHMYNLSEAATPIYTAPQPEIEEPLVDVFDEEEQVRILVQCRCREQQVTFHPSPDGITVCREECHKEKDGEVCNDVCRKLTLKTDELQLGDMLFVIAKCNNNNTLEAMIPKLKK